MPCRYDTVDVNSATNENPVVWLAQEHPGKLLQTQVMAVMLKHSPTRAPNGDQVGSVQRLRIQVRVGTVFLCSQPLTVHAVMVVAVPGRRNNCAWRSAWNT